MVTPFKKYITTLRRAKKKRRQFACVVTAMSVVVSGGVFWQLRGIGTAMTDSDLPGFDDSGGTALPLSNPSDLETAEIWEATIPPLSDNAGENLALIAESQLGYKESSSDFIHAEDGESHNGYTRYGAWYGNPYGDWNTLFTYFCMNYAGLKQEVIPYGSGCWAWSLELDKAGFITSVTRGSPKRGDILLIDSDGDGKADTSAIVCGTVEEGEAPGISVIEGDVDGCVAQKFYPYDHEGFIGTVSLDGIVPEPPVMNEAPALPTELLFSSDSDSGIHVEASADAGAFPDDTAMTVYDISQDEAVQAAAGHFGEDELDNISAVAVDITFTSPYGEELEPAEGTSVRVSISLPEEQALEGESFSLLHISDEGDIQQVEAAEVSGNGADFVAESFSVYIVTQFSDKEKDQSKEYLSGFGLPKVVINGQEFVPNSKDRPYLLRVGDKVRIYSDDAGSGFWTQYCIYNRTVADNGDVSRDATLIPDGNNADKDKWKAIVRSSDHTSNWTESGRLYAEFVAVQSGYAVIHHTRSGQETEDFWIRVFDTEESLTTLGLPSPRDEYLNHADMEIADGGKYTITKTEYVNGQKQTRVEVFDAFVSAVNQADVYSADPNAPPLASFYPENYEIIGDPGASQYELTSAFKCWWRDDKQFSNKLLDHVVFDVDIKLTPSYYYTVDTQGVKSANQPLSGEKITIPNVIYDLRDQAIVDAVNKCPLSNGLDFTVRSNAAVVKLQGKKILTGKELEENAFDFDLSLIDNNNNSSKVVATLTNDADGNFSFTQAYSETGTYNYTLKEVIKPTSEPIIFDEREINITVNVTEIDGVLVADVIYPDDKIPEFINHYSYTLPATGGSGTLPFIIFGSAMITGAAALYIIKRKKEVSC